MHWVPSRLKLLNSQQLVWKRMKLEPHFQPELVSLVPSAKRKPCKTPRKAMRLVPALEANGSWF